MRRRSLVYRIISFSACYAYQRITLALQNGLSPLLEGGWLQGWEEALAQDSQGC